MNKTSHEDKSSLPSVVIDMVCGMELDPTETKIQVEHKGETYYFCNMSCKNHFVNNPEKYIGITS